MAAKEKKYVKKDIPVSVCNLAWSLLILGAIIMAVGFVRDLNLSKVELHSGDAHAAAPAHDNHGKAAGAHAGHDHGAVDAHGTDHKADASHGDHAVATDHGSVDGHHGSGPRRFWFHGYLWMFVFLVSIAIGSMFWVLLEYLLNANWSTPLRRVPEFFSSTFIWLALLSVPLLFLGGMQDLFHHWLQPSADDAVLAGKSAWLNEGFFQIRTIALFTFWILGFGFLFRRSIRQDETGDQSLTMACIKMAPPFTFFWAFSLTFFAIDWLMTLHPHWFSTMWGVYFWSGALTVSMAVCLFTAILLFEKGYLHPRMHKHSFYNMGTFMFGFNAFWAYIAYCQYMLIWYSNMPEETSFFMPRWGGIWTWITLGMILVHFIIPVFVLVPRRAKTNLGLLKVMSIWLIFAHALDLFWLIIPSYEGAALTAWDYILSVGFPIFAIGFLMVTFLSKAKRYNMVPIKDPRLNLGLGFHLTTVDTENE